MEVKTLVELYDNRPLENVLGVELSHPDKVIYICPDGTQEGAKRQLTRYFDHRGIRVETAFLPVNIYNTEEILRVFRQVLQLHSNPVIDITGGTDAVLFAAGLACADRQTPVITYSRTQNKYYNILNAPFVQDQPCDITFSVEDCFKMAGGSMRKGRVDNSILARYMAYFDPFFAVFLKHRRRWDKIVSYIQHISAAREDGSFSLAVQGNFTVMGEHRSRLTAPEEALRDLEEIGMISNLEIQPEKQVSFCFRDSQIRTWLRDVGSVLELYIYKACLDTGIFDDVRTSAVVDWNDAPRHDAVSNELDVMCTQGITPVFISCKTCMVHTEALNELAVLRDRFGGTIARAAIVTAEPARHQTRNRAAELNIRLIDLNILQEGAVADSLRSLMK